MLNQIPGAVEALPMIESEHDNLAPRQGPRLPHSDREILTHSSTAARSCCGCSGADEKHPQSRVVQSSGEFAGCLCAAHCDLRLVW